MVNMHLLCALQLICYTIPGWDLDTLPVTYVRTAKMILLQFQVVAITLPKNKGIAVRAPYCATK